MNDYFAIYNNDASSFSLYDDQDIVSNEGSIGIMDDGQIVACCKLTSIDKMSYDEKMFSYNFVEAVVETGRNK